MQPEPSQNEPSSNLQSAEPRPRLDPSRVDPSIRSLRRHAARGTLINSGFQACLYALVTLERIVVAAWLTRSQYGFWGILVAALIGLTWIKQVGVADKYIQQSEPDQELAFQKAFTLELYASLAFFGLVLIVLPIYAVLYGRAQLIIPGFVLATMVPLTAFESPVWIAYRKLQYGRQRLLSSIDPVSTIVISITLVALGMGYWGLVVGAIAGTVIGSTVCVATCPYPFRLRFDWTTARTYVSFGFPFVALGLAGLVTVQAILLAANYSVGLAGIGAIGLAGVIVGMSDGVDTIISQTIYPVVCAVAERKNLLAEAFVKSNRVALMWAMPAMVGVALFAGDLVHYVLGERWKPAIPLFIAVALATGLDQVGFNWSIFMRAVNRTKPMYFDAGAQLFFTLVVSVPAIIAFGTIGYAIGLTVITLAQIVIRTYFMRQVLGGFDPVRQLARAVAPPIPAAAVVLLIRLVNGTPRTGLEVALELAVYCLVVVGCTYLFERPLVREIWGYLRRERNRGEFVLGAAGTTLQSGGA